MKKSMMDRLSAAAIALLCIPILVFIALCAAFPAFALSASARFAARMLSAPLLRIVLVLIVLALAALIALRAWNTVFGDRNKDAKTLKVDSHDGGAVQVSVSALEAMVRHTVGNPAGVKETDVSVASSGDALSIGIAIKAAPDSSIPQMTENIQQDVKRAIETFTGMTVKNVAVVVTSVVPNTPAKK